MKQFIVLCAVLPIFMMILMQIGLDEKNSQVTSVIQSVVYTAKEEAKQQGSFTKGIKQKIVDDINKLTGIDKSKIQVEADSKVKYRYGVGDDRIINYKVVVEIDEIMAGGSIYGISKEDNKYFYTIDSYTASEKI